MDKDIIYWREVGRFFNIEMIAPVEIELAGIIVCFTALLPQFGSANGMIVDADCDIFTQHEPTLLDAGYGFSCVGTGELDSLTMPEEKEAICEMLVDWGWTDTAPEPEWFTR